MAFNSIQLAVAEIVGGCLDATGLEMLGPREQQQQVDVSGTSMVRLAARMAGLSATSPRTRARGRKGGSFAY